MFSEDDRNSKQEEITMNLEKRDETRYLIGSTKYRDSAEIRRTFSHYSGFFIRKDILKKLKMIAIKEDLTFLGILDLMVKEFLRRYDENETGKTEKTI